MITLLRDRDQDDDDRMCTTLDEDSLLRVYTRRIKTNITCCVYNIVRKARRIRTI